MVVVKIVSDFLSRCCSISDAAKTEIEKVRNEVVGHLRVYQTFCGHHFIIQTNHCNLVLVLVCFRLLIIMK